MKNTFAVLFCILLFSCSIQKNGTKNIHPIIPVPIDSSLSQTESDIVNDFLATELKKDRYKNYKDFEIIIIDKALKKIKAIEAYLYSYNERQSINKSEEIKNIYFVDSLQIEKIKSELKKETISYWKISDFKKTKVNLLTNEELKNILNTVSYTNLPNRLIIHLSKPLIIDKNNALISFDIGNGKFGYSAINHSTILMKKVNNTWEQGGYYEDGVFY